MSLFRAIINGDVQLVILLLLSRVFVVLFCLPVHEMAHAYTAYKLGDKTAKENGRLTFNPLAQLDPIGTFMIFVLGIGYAKPVPVNPAKFKNPRSGMALTALAGPLSNLLMAFVSMFLCYGILALSSSLFAELIAMFFNYAAIVNVSLAVFNLIPIPPLDGSKVLSVILPDEAYFKLLRYERYMTIILIVILFTNVGSGIIGAVSDFVLRLISFIPSIIFVR